MTFERKTSNGSQQCARCVWDGSMAPGQTYVAVAGPEAHYDLCIGCLETNPPRGFPAAALLQWAREEQIPGGATV